MHIYYRLQICKYCKNAVPTVLSQEKKIKIKKKKTDRSTDSKGWGSFLTRLDASFSQRIQQKQHQKKRALLYRSLFKDKFQI